MYYYQRLRDLREDENKTQQEIADYLQMKQPQYNRYESGTREIPVHILIELAKYYNISLDYIVGLTKEKRKLKD